MIDLGFNVRLGPLRHENCWNYYRARNDYRVWKWCRQNDLLTEDAHEQWLLSVQNNPKIKMYEILGKVKRGDHKDAVESLECVGVCGLTDIDHTNQRAEFSLYVFPEHQGMGYGKSGLETLILHGFNNLNLNRIWGETFEGNDAHKMFEALGFEKEGRRRDFYFREGKFIDAILYSVGRKKWSPPS